MKIVRNKIIPFPGNKDINLFGVLFVRPHAILTDEDINHALIHTKLMKELLYIFFYLIYGIEWVINRFKYDSHKAYRKIKFEVEAYKYQGDPQYLMNRKHYAQWRKSKDPELL